MILHRIELHYVDCCTSDYLTDHTGVLYGVPVDNASTWADVKQDLLHEIDHDSLTAGDFDEAKAAVERWFNMTCKPNAREETRCAPTLPYTFDDDANTYEPSSIWFRLKGARREA